MSLPHQHCNTQLLPYSLILPLASLLQWSLVQFLTKTEHVSSRDVLTLTDLFEGH